MQFLTVIYTVDDSSIFGSYYISFSPSSSLISNSGYNPSCFFYPSYVIKSFKYYNYVIIALATPERTISFT